jgi:hypothetical protein
MCRSAYAAPSPTQLAAEILTTDGTDFTTASFAITANRLVTMFITAAIPTTGATITAPTVTCHGATWVNAGEIQAGLDPERAHFLYRTMIGSSSASATCAIAFSETLGRMSYSVQEWSGVDTSGTHGSGAIVQVITEDDGGSPCEDTFAAFGSTDNRPVYSARVGSTTAHSPEANWTELSDPTGAENMSHSVGWKDAADDTTVSVTTGSGTCLLVGAEIKAGADGRGAPMMQGIIR